MGLDVRLPIGAMFFTAGLLLAVYGLITNGDSETYRKSLSIDINLWWGLAMAAFGLIFLLLAFRARKAAPLAATGTPPDDAAPRHG
jgi:H+/Cl- antiporter ClcA